MFWWIGMSFIIGGIVGALGMAILASGGMADERLRAIVVREALRDVYQWYNFERAKRLFPWKKVENALKE